jgi:hypothetical protein
VWLRCKISKDGYELLLCLSRQDLLRTAIRWGDGSLLHVDTTHGCQKYGPKLILVHVKDEFG